MLWVSGRADGHRQGELRGREGVVIPYRVWQHHQAEAVILYLHGQGEHSGPFTAMGDTLHEQGFTVFAHDHRGFGLSPEQRGHIRTYELFVDDTLSMLGHANRACPGLPVFLLGLSMGGHIALRSAHRAGSEVAGVVALSPGFKLRNPPTWSQVLKVGALALLFPDRYLPSVMDSIITTRNEHHLARAQQDEHYVTRFTARFYLEAIRSIRKAKRELKQLKVPVLILQAGEDYLICPETNRRYFEQIGHPDKEFRLLGGLCHNLVAEPEMPQISQDVAQWMKRRLGPVMADNP